MDDLDLAEIAPPKARKPSPLGDLDLGDLSPLQLMRIVDAKAAALLRGQSVRAVRRQFSDRMIELGPRREGIRLYQALELPAPKLPK